MRIIDCQQQSDEWFEARKGKMTGSQAQAIGSNGKGLETYIYNLMAEKYSSSPGDQYSNDDTDRGNELEDTARKLYELEKGVEISRVGFVEFDEFSGVSPDGLIAGNGLIEIKCPNDKNHFHIAMTSEIDTKYQWQMQMQLLVTGRNWCDFISFNPNFTQDLIIIRVEKDEKKQEKLKEGLLKGKNLIIELTKKYEGIS